MGISGMKFTQAKTTIGKYGCTLQKTEYDEYRVNWRGGKEATAYYTNDLDDAVATARAMHVQKFGGPGPQLLADLFNTKE